MKLLLDFIAVIVIIVFAIGCVETASNEEFHEELIIRPLPENHVNTYFQFTTRWHYGDRSNLHNTKLTPRSIAEILLEYDVKELHVSLVQGLWRYESWGYPVEDAAAGAEVWGWFAGANLTDEQVDEQWARLSSVFSGILCASLNFIDKTNSVEPKYNFRPQFSTGRKVNDEKRYVRYSSLPREIVCTENLTPWKKLLPCSSKYGFASLLNSGHVHNTKYHTLGIKMRTLCAPTTSEENCILELTETTNLVYDMKLLSGPEHEFSLRRLFGQGLNGHCVLAKSSKIYVQLDEEGERYELSPQPDYTFESIRGGYSKTYGIYDIQNNSKLDRLFNIAWVQNKKHTVLPTTVKPPPIYAHRYILGQGQERGRIITEITNSYYAKLTILLQEHIPWFVPIYLHTLNVRILSTGEEVKPHLLHYIPGIQRKRPYHVEIGLLLPPKSTLQISIDFDYIFLKWVEYPPDANHGYYLGSAVISAKLPIGLNYTSIPLEGYLFADSFNASRASYFLTLHTEALILSLPTPDFSMPYNVICLACTVVALAFGPIHSVATKRIVVEQIGASPQGFARKFLNKLLHRKTQIQSSRPAPDDNEVLRNLNDVDDDAVGAI